MSGQANGRTRHIGALLLVVVLVAGAVLGQGASGAQAQAGRGHLKRVQALGAEDTGVAHPVGLAYSPRAGAFHVLGAGASGAETEVVRLTGWGERAGAARIAAAVRDPILVAYDGVWGRLLIYQSPANRLVEVREGPGGDLDPMSVVRHDVRGWGVEDPQGLAVDPGSGAVYVLDGAGPRLVVVEPGGEGTWADAAVRAVELAGLEGARGLAVDPGTGHLHVYSPAGERLVELAGTGEVVATRETGELGLRSVEGLVVAPSGDQTDAAGATSLYVADAEAGAIVELSLAEAAPVAMAAAASATLVRTVHTSEWSPPSPDPMGLTYLPNAGQLLLSDSEVNEMPLYADVNVWQTTLKGQVLQTYTTLEFSDEPAGLAYNPVNGHLYIGDDTGPRGVYTLDPGPDGILFTEDDQVRFLRTSDFGSRDPEGLAYDPASGVLYIADGVNREIYRVHPGPNGVFDGIPPAGDDEVSGFDTLGLGLDDPEGLAYDPVSGYLLAVGKPRRVLFIMRTDGTLVDKVSLPVDEARAPSGLALAPCSEDAARMCLYMVDRGVDNDSDPNENDGILFELDLGWMMPTPTLTPTRTSTPVPTAPTSPPPPSPTATRTLVTPAPATATPTATRTVALPTPIATATATGNASLPTATNAPTATPQPTEPPDQVLHIPLVVRR